MTMTIPSPDRRVDRSPFIDLALEKFLTRLRTDLGLSAVVLADDEGHLVAATAQVAPDQALAALGVLSADLYRRLEAWPPGPAPRQVQLTTDRDERMSLYFFRSSGTWLALTLVGGGDLPADLIDRAREGISRILDG